MSMKAIENEIIKFINSSNPEVLAIHGQWGNGKTYFWNRTLRSHYFSSKKFSKYSYVSLFGINSLADLRNTIFSTTVETEDIERMSLPKRFLSIKSWRNWFYGVIKTAPYVRNYGEVINSAISFFIRDTIICLDDLERKGDQLTINEMLGLICLLKEQQNCKIIIIYNEDKIDGSHKNEFMTLKEKVIDKDIEFNLTPEECCDITLSRDEKFHDCIKKNVIKLGIKNIRIIKKITSLYDSLKEINLSDYSDKVVARLLHSLCIFCYSYYSQGNIAIPTIEFLTNLENKMIFQEKSEEKPPHEEQYLSFLREYGYSHTDELDLVILEGIKRGFFNNDLHNETQNLKTQLLKEDTMESLEKAWEIYHNSFDDNTTDVINSLRENYYKYRENIPTNYVDAMLNLFRQLGSEDIAENILNDFIDNLRQKGIVINQENYPFFDSLKDHKLINSLKELEKEESHVFSIESILDDIVKNKQWNESQIKFLASLASENYKTLFKSTKGKQLTSYINTCLKFGNLTPQKENYEQITNLVKSALINIARENTLNKARVSKFGVYID